MSYFSDQLRAMYDTMLRLAADPTSELYYEGHQRTGAGHRAAFWDGYNGMVRSPHIIPGTLSGACGAAGRAFRKQHDRAGIKPVPRKWEN
jgi:hypothetical protein